MSNVRPLVKNAADPEQVKAAGRVVHRRENRQVNNLRAVLSTPEGRAVLFDIVQLAGVRAGIFDHSGSVTYFKAGRQNFGFELLAQFEAADEEGWALAQSEARQSAKRDANEAEAARTPSAQEKQ